jgi:hypothetical protein
MGVLAAIPWKLVAKLAWLGVARPLLKLIVEKTETKGDDKVFEFLDELVGKVMGDKMKFDAEVQKYMLDHKLVEKEEIKKHMSL